MVFSPKEILLDTNTFSISASPKKQKLYDGKIYICQLQYYQMLKFIYPFLYVKIIFYVL